MNRLALIALLAAGCVEPSPPSKPKPAEVVAPKPEPPKAKERDIVLLAVRLRDAGVGEVITPGMANDIMYLDGISICEFKSADIARVTASELDQRFSFAYKQFVIMTGGHPEQALSLDVKLATLRRARAALAFD